MKPALTPPVTRLNVPMGAVQTLLDEHGLSPEGIAATGKSGRLLKGCVTPETSAPQPRLSRLRRVLTSRISSGCRSER